jgi:GT2 family glycosyltransferase
MSPDEAGVVVVIPAQQAGEVLRRQLDALTRQKDAPSFSVVVVMAEDGDPGRRVVADFEGVLSTVIVEAPMKGAASARNAGAANSMASIILFCDADDRVGTSWVKHMAAQTLASGIAGGPIIVDRGATPAWAWPFYLGFERSPLQKFYGSIPFVMSASMGIRRDLFKSADGFDESFPGSGGEEVDLCIRLAGTPFGIVVDRDAAVSYLPRPNFRSVLKQRMGYSRGAARIIVEHDLDGIGSVMDTDWTQLASTSRSLRRLAITACSFLALRREMRRLQRSRTTAR